MEALIAVLPGDGIGPEVTAAATPVLEQVARLGNHKFELREALIGGAAIDATGEAFPRATASLCAEAQATLLGAVGGPKWSDPEQTVRPEQGLLDMRAALGVFANLRPVKPYPELAPISPLKADRLAGVDIMVVRELTGGIYFGAKTRSDDVATDECRYTRSEIERIVHVAADLAAARRNKITSVDKSNVLETSKLWRATVNAVLPSAYPDIEFEHLLVDAAAMHLLSRPADFDVLVTENMFGDILTDEASMLAGSLGMLPSASLGTSGNGLYEPIHGSAPDIAGQGIANPCGTILSVAMLLRHSLGLDEEAQAVEAAVTAAVAAGCRTRDIALPDDPALSTSQMSAEIIQRLTANT
jgi:3-isopropylmalate dehydrogenase